MKKIISILLSALLLIFSAAGCRIGESAIAQQANPCVQARLQIRRKVQTQPRPIQEEPPDNNWKLDAPENHGVDGALLAKLHDAVKDKEIYSVVVVKDGQIIDEYYKHGMTSTACLRCIPARKASYPR